MTSAFSFPFDSGGSEMGGGGDGLSASCDVCHRKLTAHSDVQTLPCLHNFCITCFPPQGCHCPLCARHSQLSGYDMGDGGSSQPLPQYNNSFEAVPSPRSLASSDNLLRSSGGVESLSSPLNDVSSLRIDTGNIWGNLIAPASNATSDLTSHQRMFSSFSGLPSEPFGGRHNYQGMAPFAGFSNNKTTFNDTPVSFAEFNSSTSNNLSGRIGTIGPPNGSSNGLMCASCNEGVMANSKCEDCCELLCASCVQAHYRVRLTRDHRVVPLMPHMLTPSTGSSQHTDMGSSSLSTGSRPSPLVSPPGLHSGNVCINHQDILWVICDTCARPLCRKCLPEHSAHSFALLKGDNIKGVATQMLVECRNVQRTLEEALDSVQRTTERVESRVQSVANEVKANLHYHISALEERKRDLLQRVDTVRQAKIQTLEAQRESLVHRLSSIKQAADQAESVLKVPSDQESNGNRAARVQQLLLQQLAEPRMYLTPHETDGLAFISPDPSILASIKSLASIQAGAYAGKCMVIGDTYRRSVRDRTAYLTVQTRDAVGDCCPRGGDNVAVSILNPQGHPLDVNVQDRHNGTYLTSYKPDADGHHTVRITVRGKMIAGCPFTVQVRKGRDYMALGAQPRMIFCSEGSLDGQINRPWGICCDRHGRLLVADRSNNRIQIFDRDGRYLFKFGTGGPRPGQFDRPAGLAVNSKNEIVVADKDNHRVQIFTMEGNFVLKFGERGRGNGQFHYPWDVAVNSEDHIAVTDTRNHRVQLFSHDGNFLRKFGFDNALYYKHFDSPRGICFMPDGQMLVTDFNNHRLAMIHMSTGDMKFYGKEGEIDGHFKRPQGVDVDLEGYVIVTDSKNNRLQVFSPDMQPMCSFGWEGAEKPALLDRPVDVCISPDGTVYVVDMGNNRICIF